MAYTPLSIRVTHEPIPHVCGLCEGAIEAAGDFGIWVYCNLPPRSKAVCINCTIKHEPLLARCLAFVWQAEYQRREAVYAH